MKKKIFIFLSFLLGLAILLGLIIKLNIIEVLIKLKSISHYGIAIIFLIYLVYLFFSVMRWKLILKLKGNHVPFYRLVIGKLIDHSVSYITPILYIGGEPLRAYYLKKKVNFDLHEGMASAITDKMVEFFSLFLFAIPGIFIIIFLSKMDILIKLILALVFVGALLVFILYHKRIKGGKTFFSSIFKKLIFLNSKLLNKAVKALMKIDKLLSDYLKGDIKLFTSLIILSVCAFIMSLIKYKTILHFLGYDAGLNVIYLIYILMILAYMFPYIPGALGLYEGVNVLVFSLLGLSPELGLAFALVNRAVEIVFVLIGFYFISQLGIKNIFEKITNSS